MLDTQTDNPFKTRCVFMFFIKKLKTPRSIIFIYNQKNNAASLYLIGIDFLRQALFFVVN